MSELTREQIFAVKEKGQEAAKILIQQFAMAICGFLLARTCVFEDYLPFGIALTASVPSSYIFTASLGAVAGYIVPAAGSGGFRYIAAVLIISAVRWLAAGFLKGNKSAAISSFLPFITMTVTGCFLSTVNGLSGYTAVMYGAEGLFCGACAYFFNRFFTLLSSPKKHVAFSSQELACTVISLAILTLSLSKLTIASLSPVRILMLIAVLAAARYGHESAGAIAGIAAGLVMSLSGDEYLFAAAGFALAGLLAGVFSPLGKMGCCVAFVLSNGIVALRAVEQTNLIIILYEVMVASVLFLILPKRTGVFFAEVFSPGIANTKTDSLRQNLVMRLNFASYALNDVSKTVDTVASKLKKVSSPDFEKVFAKTEQAVCSHCSLRIYCWETSRGNTLSALLSATKQLRNHRNFLPEDLPEDFVKRCAHSEDLTLSLKKNYNDFLARESAERRVTEIRGVVSEQFNGISQMLNNLADEFEEFESYDNATAERIAGALNNCGIIASDISCRCDKFGRMTAEICIETPNERINRSILMRELSMLCDRDFDVPCVTTADGYTLMTLTERAIFKTDFGAAQISCGDNRLCGDAYEQFNDGRGHSVIIISDGMGNGGRAAVDGAMASGLMSRLIKAGFGFDCALDIVNSAMLFKSSDESLATVDITTIDLFTGYTEFYKAGAPATIVCRNKKAIYAEGASLPPGILRDVSFEKNGLTLSDGDIVLMVSDGALCDGTDWIGVELEVFKNGTAQQLAEHIADYAKRRSGDSHPDDITVLAAIIGKN